MRQFNVTVNGTAYQVSVEEVGSVGTPPSFLALPGDPVKAAEPAAAPVTAAAPTPAPAIAPAASMAAAGGEQVLAPMPGTILDLKVTEGGVVNKGDVLLILEAMKMENEILSPVDATVRQVLVANGAAVNSGDVLIVLG